MNVLQSVIDAAKAKVIKMLALSAEMELMDGTIVTTNDAPFEEGVEIFGIDAEGNNYPLETKEEPYTTKEGQEFWVIEGKISFTKPEMAIPEQAPVTESVDFSEEVIETVIEEVNLASEITELKNQLELQNKQIVELAEMFNKQVEFSTELSKNLAKKPASNPIEARPIELSGKSDLAAKLEELIKKNNK